MADATPWRIDPDTFTLIEPPRPRPQGYTTREFDNQVWPPCPVYGTTIEVQPIRMSSLATLSSCSFRATPSAREGATSVASNDKSRAAIRNGSPLRLEAPEYRTA